MVAFQILTENLKKNLNGEWRNLYEFSFKGRFNEFHSRSRIVA